MSENITGKYIYELEALIGNLKNEAWFVVSQDNLTRRIPARSIKKFINGDDDQPSDENYYSSLKIKEIADSINTNIEKNNNKITNLENRLTSISETISSNYSTLDQRITSLINNINDVIVPNINIKISQEVTARTEADADITRALNEEVRTRASLTTSFNDHVTESNRNAIKLDLLKTNFDDHVLDYTNFVNASNIEGNFKDLWDKYYNHVSGENGAHNKIDSKLEEITTLTSDLDKLKKEFNKYKTDNIKVFADTTEALTTLTGNLNALREDFDKHVTEFNKYKTDNIKVFADTTEALTTLTGNLNGLEGKYNVHIDTKEGAKGEHRVIVEAFRDLGKEINGGI